MTAAAQPQELLVRLLDPSNRADPYPAYAEIRERGPIRLPEINLTVFSSHRDCDEVLRHPSAASDFRKATPVQAALSAADEVDAYGEPSFLFLDPPDHTRLRKLVSKAFVPKVVKALEPDITTLVDALLDSVAQKGTFDVIADLAHPLPVAVICRLLGVPLEDEPEFSAASALSVQSLDPFITFTGQAPENMERQVQAEAWLFDYLRDLVTRRRSDPADDLMSALIQVEESGDQLTEEEIIATCTLLLVAGHEPDRQRDSGDVASTAAMGGAGRERIPGAYCRRGDAALRPARSADGPNRGRRHDNWRDDRRQGRYHDVAAGRGTAGSGGVRPTR
jgi:cytochrome P450